MKGVSHNYIALENKVKQNVLDANIMKGILNKPERPEVVAAVRM